MIVKLSKNKEIEFSGRDLPSFLNSFWYFVIEVQLIDFHDLKNTYSEETLSDDQGLGVVKNLDMDSTEYPMSFRSLCLKWIKCSSYKSKIP